MRGRVFQLVVFDLDGTLVDSTRDLANSANDLLAGYGAAPLDVPRVVAMVGEGARVLVERILKASDVSRPLDEALAQFLQIYERRIADHTVTYPGVREALTTLHASATLAVLTNKPARHTRLLLDALNLTAFFGEVIGGDTTFPRKPDPAGLRHLVDAAGARPETTLMVGDSIVDLQTARAARTAFCLAAYGFGSASAEGAIGAGDLVAADLTRVADFVTRPI